VEIRLRVRIASGVDIHFKYASQVTVGERSVKSLCHVIPVPRGGENPAAHPKQVIEFHL